MNLRVDLILESEQRSGSLLSPKSLIRIAIIVLPLILGIVLASAAYKTWQLSAERKQLEEQLRNIGNRTQEAKDLQEQVAKNENIVAKLTWWHNSRLDWVKVLVGLQKVVPDTIQLQMLSIPEKIKKGDAPAREFTMTLQGKAVGTKAKENVKRLAADIKKAPEFKELLESSKVTSFLRDASQKADPNDRIFKIECKFKPRT